MTFNTRPNMSQKSNETTSGYKFYVNGANGLTGAIHQHKEKREKRKLTPKSLKLQFRPTVRHGRRDLKISDLPYVMTF